MLYDHTILPLLKTQVKDFLAGEADLKFVFSNK
jgi:hypothetical protein